MPPADAIVLVNPGDKVVEVHYGPDSYRVRPKEQVRINAVAGRSSAHIDELVRIGLLHEVGARAAPPARATSSAKKAAAPAKKRAAPAKKAAAKKQATRSNRSTRKRPGGS